MTTKIQLEETGGTITDFTNYQVILLFQQPGTPPEVGTTATSSMLTVSKSGLAEFSQENLQVEGLINISVKAPAGNIIVTKEIEKNLLIGQPSFRLEFGFTRVNLTDKIVQPTGMLTGRLLDVTGKRKMDEIQIVIFASASSTPEQFYPLLTVTTETGGYFFAAYPSGEFSAANAVIGIQSVTGKNKVKITLDKNENDKGIFPKRLLLVLEPEESDGIPAAKKDCGCDDLDFHDPKRILDEFSFYSIIRTSDPEIKAYAITQQQEISLEDLLRASPTSSYPIVTGIIADPVRVFGHPGMSSTFHVQPGATALIAHPVGTLGAAGTAPILTEDMSQALKKIKIKKTVVRDFMDKYKVLNKDTYINLLEMNDAENVKNATQDVLQAPLGRTFLNSNNLVDWDNDPTIYQATSIAYGHLLHYKQQWLADGYSLGDLVYSLPLAPGQKKTNCCF